MGAQVRESVGSHAQGYGGGSARSVTGYHRVGQC